MINIKLKPLIKAFSRYYVKYVNIERREHTIDIRCPRLMVIGPNETRYIPTDLEIDINNDHTIGLVMPYTKCQDRGLLLLNGGHYIDNSSSDNIALLIHNLNLNKYISIKKGERIAQLLLYSQYSFQLVIG